MLERELAHVVPVRRRAEVSEDVSAAEAIDGLLGIADDHETAVRGHRLAPGDPGRIDGLEDSRLQTIRILELIYQGHRVPRAEALRQHLACFPRKRVIEFREHRVEAQVATLPCTVAQRVSRLFKDPPPSVRQPQLAHLVSAGSQCFEVIVERDVGQFLGPPPAQFGRERLSPEIASMSERQQVGIVGVERAADLIQAIRVLVLVPGQGIQGIEKTSLLLRFAPGLAGGLECREPRIIGWRVFPGEILATPNHARRGVVTADPLADRIQFEFAGFGDLQKRNRFGRDVCPPEVAHRGCNIARVIATDREAERNPRIEAELG